MYFGILIIICIYWYHSSMDSERLYADCLSGHGGRQYYGSER